MSKKLRNLQTMHTHIQRGEVEFNAPMEYTVCHTQSGKIAGEIKFQKGPVQEAGLNGVFLEDLLLISIDQLEHFQNSEFACEENEDTLLHLRAALASTRARQYDRMIRNVQGQYKK